LRIGRIVREVEILPDEELEPIPIEPDDVPSLPEREPIPEEPAAP
jgi:hypothetical protein